MSDFTKFSKPVYDRFTQMSKNELFVVDISGDDLWDAYLKAFPEGTNPLYKTRTEYDCSCCKNFVRNVGNVVMIEADGNLGSVWAKPGVYPFPFDIVAATLNTLVVNAKIVSVFRSKEKSYGAVQTRQMLPDGSVHRWNHFHADIALRHQSKEVATVKGEKNTTAQVYERGLKELSLSAVSQVIDLIDAKALYRGDEFLPSLKDFHKAQKAYAALSDDTARNVFVWSRMDSPSARFRNTVIGTLVQDISEGRSLESAVSSFEAKVAPTNYKRPTALITPKMVEQAMDTIKAEGLDASLERRLAKLSDVSVNNVLWVDNAVKGLMKTDDLKSTLLAATKPREHKLTDAENISISDFMSSVLPQAQGIEVMVKNTHLSNFMSLTAPVHADSVPLFKWENGFAWSYDGNITDSIKEKVKAAGGNVTNANLRISLAWFNYDDLDLHIIEPGGNRIYFGAKRSYSSGILDVDMNISPTTRTPVENVSWTRVPDGKYQVYVNNFTKRSNDDVGCVIEVECAGVVTQLSHPGAVTNKSSSFDGATLRIADVHIRNGKVEKIEPTKGVIGGGISQEKWGVKTEDFAKVQTVMFSPNYWDDKAVGNKHWFFILDNCKNDMPVRGIYNEFLDSRFEKHRKVFEVLGDKTKCAVVDEQLSGLGFSSTKKDVLTVRVKGAKLQKVYNINF